jgi:hypothetical protein
MLKAAQGLPEKFVKDYPVQAPAVSTIPIQQVANKGLNVGDARE